MNRKGAARLSRSFVTAARNLWVLAWVLLILPWSAAAQVPDPPLSSPANFGWTGLWETPTAELLEDGTGWVGMSQVHPYQPYYAALGFLPDLEVSFALTTTMGGPVVIEGSGWYPENYGDYKDKSLAVKWRLLRQQGILPSLAVGVTDLTGTEILKAYYGVATWRQGPVALSLGYGTDRMNGFFGGVSWSLTPWLEFKGEYAPFDYTKDIFNGTRIFSRNPDQRWNLGLVAKTDFGLDLSLSRQRDEWGFAVSYRFDLRNPFFLGERRGEIRAWIPARPLAISFDEFPPDLLGERLVQALQEAFGRALKALEVRVAPETRAVEVAFEAPPLGAAELTARVLLLVSGLVPPDTDSVFLVLRSREEDLARVEISGVLARRIAGRLLDRQDLEGLRVQWTDPARRGDPSVALAFGTSERRSALWAGLVYEPRIDRTLYNDYMQRLGLDLAWEGVWGNGWGFLADVRVPLYNDIDIWWEPMTGSQTRIWKAAVSKLHRLDENAYLLGEFGWLDDTWFGTNLWIRREFQEGRFWLGVRGAYVHERDPGSFGALADRTIPYDHPAIGNFKKWWGIQEPDAEWYWGAWIQAGYRDPTYDLDLSLSWGRFLGGRTWTNLDPRSLENVYQEDRGWRVDVVRHWGDVGLGFYFAQTDIKASGKDYSDAGILLDMPLEAFWGERRTKWWPQEFTLLSSWNVNSARMPGSWQSPESLLRPLVPQRLQRDLRQRLGEVFDLPR